MDHPESIAKRLLLGLNIDGEDIYIFEYKQSVAASDAKMKDLGMVPKPVETEEIQPYKEFVLVSINCDVVGVSRKALEENSKIVEKRGVKSVRYD